MSVRGDHRRGGRRRGRSSWFWLFVRGKRVREVDFGREPEKLVEKPVENKAGYHVGK